MTVSEEPPAGGARASGITLGRERERDPLLEAADGSPGPAADGLVLVVIGSGQGGLWRLAQSEVETFAARHRTVTTVVLEAGDELGDAVCDRHDVDVFPTLLLYEDGQQVAARTGAFNADRLARFTTR